MDKRKIEAFIADLAELSKKHGVIVGGCGECGSPWVEERSPDYYAADYASLQWHEDTERYTYD
jgi:hypothetical protein